MKSEERHQLLTNDLGVVTERTVGFFERHVGTIIGIVCAALLIGAVGFWWSQSADTEVESGWTLLRSAQTLEDFGAVIDKYKNEPAGQWAQLLASEMNLKNGLPLMFTNREIGVTDINSAKEGFESLVKQKVISPQVRERALWGLGQCLESTCDGDTSKAVEVYEKLLNEFKDTMFKSAAEERVATLKKPEAKEFYAWFSKENPKPPEARPRDFKNDSSKSDTLELPDLSNTKEEGGLDGLLPKFNLSPEKTDPISPKEPLPDDKKPEANPVEPAQPAEGDKPAAEEKPSEPAPEKSVEEPAKKD
jgi:hypothetical protein